LNAVATPTRKTGPFRKVALVGNHLPRRCGIATFTTDLADAIISEAPGLDCQVLAMSEAGQHYDYPPRVTFEIGESDVASYLRAADFLGINAVDVVSIQHEYGIFGGKAGVLLLDAMRALRMPVVTTLHTILADPSPTQRSVMNEIVRLSARLVVMSTHGAELLRRVHGVDASRIDVIPHGIPAVPVATQDSKDKLGVEGHEVVLTFGLLSPDKGIEHVIDALPHVVERFPNVVYVVLGVTHPHVRDHDGEAYRLMLESRAKRLRVDRNIVFHDRFVNHDELVAFLSAADIYITPYLNAAQITSGTLAYAVGCGKAVISTPYRYACELLAEERGVLVPFCDPPGIARAIVELLADPDRRKRFEARASSYGRNMAWPVVARRYIESFQRAREEQSARLHAIHRAKTLANRPVDLPAVDLSHVHLMTDDTGMLQHATLNVPRYGDGYCLDDNARALLCATLVEEAGVEPPKVVRALASRYLAFVSHAFDRKSLRFRNLMDFDRRWQDGEGSEDSHGRALWALGAVVSRSADRPRRTLARELFHVALPAVSRFTSPRAWAYALLGIDEYLAAFQGEGSVETMRTLLSQKLIDAFHQASTVDWPWFEDRLTYCNARLSQALIVSGQRMGNDHARETGLRSLEWLCSVQFLGVDFSPIGSNGFWVRGAERARFDQQPVEAAATLSACLSAFAASREPIWMQRASRVFQWFLGQNALQTSLYDAATGGCRDGLHVDRVNENQGAESTLSFLVSLLEMRAAARAAPPELE
jgi:glycosyltransferase involved in cell wall biosynthesis